MLLQNGKLHKNEVNFHSTNNFQLELEWVIFNVNYY